MIIRTDYFINAVGEGNMPKVEEFLTKDIEINRLHSLEGAYVLHVCTWEGLYRCIGSRIEKPIYVIIL